jgi:hypothetical protein
MTENTTLPEDQRIPVAPAGQEEEDRSHADPDATDEKPPESDQDDNENEEDRQARLDLETEDDKAQKPLDAAIWGSTGHAAADEAMRTLQNVGLSTTDAMELLWEAAMARDPGKVDPKALVAKIGPRRAKTIMQNLEAFSQDMRPKDERISNEVYQHTNGPNAFRRLIEQGSEKLSPSELQGYVLEMGKGGPSAQRAVERLKAIVSGEGAAPDRKVHTDQYTAPKPLVRPDTSKGITSKAYLAEMEALHKVGNRLGFEARDRRVADLRTARRLGRENGLP